MTDNSNQSLRMRIALVVMLTALLASACGGSTSETNETISADAETTTTEATTTTTVVATTTTEPDATSAADDASSQDAVHDGASLFESTCARCHGVDGIGTQGPDLFDLAVTYPDREEIVTIISTGPGRMPAFADDLDPAEIDAITDHVYATFG